MSRGISHAVGNEFVPTRRPLLAATSAVVVPQPALAVASVPIEAIPQQETIPVMIASSHSITPFSRLVSTMHHHSLVSFSLLLLLVGVTGIEVGNRYWTAHILAQMKPLAATAQLTPTISGPSLTVPNSQLQTKLQTIASQSANITVGTQTVPISPDVIKSWLRVTSNRNHVQDYIQVNTKAVDASLLALANQYVAAPVSQVSLTSTDGVSPPTIVLAGKNGTALSNPSALTTQAQQSVNSVMNAQGVSFNTPLQTVPFQAVTPCAFSKSLYADVSTNRLYAYQGCQLVNTFLSTDGKPSDPTPIGEFHIWAKLTMQTMSGPGYVQPNVPWINYFDHSGDAVHGNYWRPASYFGSVWSSHGCVGLQVSQAEWVYNWAPIGTTVITYTQ